MVECRNCRESVDCQLFLVDCHVPLFHVRPIQCNDGIIFNCFLHSKRWSTLLHPHPPNVLHPFTPPLSNPLSMTANFHLIVAFPRLSGKRLGQRHLSSSQFLDEALCCHAKNTTTNNGADNSKGGRLIWTNRKPLVPWFGGAAGLPMEWRERASPLSARRCLLFWWLLVLWWVVVVGCEWHIVM